MMKRIPKTIVAQNIFFSTPLLAPYKPVSPKIEPKAPPLCCKRIKKTKKPEIKI